MSVATDSRIQDWQDFIGEWSKETFGGRDPSVTVIKMREEVEELASRIRSGDQDGIQEELVDVLITALVMAYEIDMDLELGLMAKMVINKHRGWYRNPDGTFSHVKADPNG